MSTDSNSKVTQPKVCLVTGGSSGIGLATACRFAADGYRVVIAARNREKLAAAAEIVSRCGVIPCAICAADFRKATAAEGVISDVLERFCRLDVLVHSAGVASLTESAQYNNELFQEIWLVNGRAFAQLSRAAWPIFQKQREGVIVYISSMAAFDPFPGLGIYGASKAWGNHFVRSLASEGRAFNIRAFAVCPGAVETPMLRRLYPDFEAAKALAPEAVAAVIRRLSEPSMSVASGNAITIQQ
jgi:NAD(P)-dependent dehydrogenase (short-subunit alcohol dehydrogenase family)